MFSISWHYPTTPVTITNTTFGLQNGTASTQIKTCSPTSRLKINTENDGTNQLETITPKKNNRGHPFITSAWTKRARDECADGIVEP